MMFCFKRILQIWIILIGFRDTILWTSVFENMSSNSPAVAIAALPQNLRNMWFLSPCVSLASVLFQTCVLL